MKLVILAGGYGTRLSEETKIRPKPLVKIGEEPIIWHLMKIYSSFGINEFIICLGYKGYMIKKELKKYTKKENWIISFIETGLHTMTGGRIKRVEKYLNNEKNFCLSYGDGLSNVNIEKLIKFHINSNKIATLTAVKYRNPKGVLSIKKNMMINNIKEKPVEYINGGFFVLEPNVFDYIKDNKTIWEKDPMEKLVKINQLVAYKHVGFYQSMDTMGDKKILEKMWEEKKASWKVWK